MQKRTYKKRVKAVSKPLTTLDSLSKAYIAKGTENGVQVKCTKCEAAFIPNGVRVRVRAQLVKLKADAKSPFLCPQCLMN